MAEERSVLVVEDDAALALMLQELLEGEGYTVVTVHDGQRALHEGLSREFDVIVMGWGAEDYLGKPFDIEELLARLRSLLRRHSETTAALRIPGRVLEPGTRTVALAAGAGLCPGAVGIRPTTPHWASLSPCPTTAR